MDNQIKVVDDYAYVGLDLCNEPNLELLEGDKSDEDLGKIDKDPYFSFFCNFLNILVFFVNIFFNILVYVHKCLTKINLM